MPHGNYVRLGSWGLGYAMPSHPWRWQPPKLRMSMISPPIDLLPPNLISFLEYSAFFQYPHGSLAHPFLSLTSPSHSDTAVAS
jgi:hypothetical protein